MRKAIALLMLLCGILGAQAQTYKTLWGQYDRSLASDLPQDQLRALDAIATKAAAEKAYGHLLKAKLLRMQAAMDVSPDSLRPALERLEGDWGAASLGGDKALAAVYATAIGRTYALNFRGDTALTGRQKLWYTRAMAAPDVLLRTKADGYAPAMEQTVQGPNVWGDDLLHVVGMETGRYGEMIAAYQRAGNREAACIATVLMVRTERAGATGAPLKRHIHTLDSLLAADKDLTACGEAAVERYALMAADETVEDKDRMEFINAALQLWGAWPRINILRNAQKELTRPAYQVVLPRDGVVCAGATTMARVLGLTNIDNLRLTLQPTTLLGNTTLDPRNQKDLAKIREALTGKPVTVARRYVGQPAYKAVQDTIVLPALESGVYLVEFSTDNDRVPVERQLLYATRLFVMSEALPNGKTRFVVVDRETGQPVAGAKLQVVASRDDKTTTDKLVCDDKGEAICAVTGSMDADRVFAYTDTDRAFKARRVAGRYSFYDSKDNTDRLAVFTDRAIYRPGQQVQVVAVAYRDLAHTDSEVRPDTPLTLILRDANYKEVGRKEVRTDEFGTASATFDLPAQGLTGTWSVRTDHVRSNGSAFFRVEEYKRPTFRAEFQPVTAHYEAGDTVRVQGRATSFAGVPVDGATVRYTVTRRAAWWWRYAGTGDTQTLITDTVRTDNDGTFTARVPMQMPENALGTAARFYTFDVKATITDVAGETHTAATALPLGNRATAFSLDIDNKIRQDIGGSFTCNLRNAAGNEVEGDVVFDIDGKAGKCKANEKVDLKPYKLAPARHTITAVCGTDTIRQQFVVFSLKDTKPAPDTSDWFYITDSRFYTTASEVQVQVGSSAPDQHIVYNVFAGDSVLESGTIDQSNALHNRVFRYKEAYGDGITLTYAWVKNDTLYSHSATITAPLPSKWLTTKWETFRDRLQPGQQEQWTLHISNAGRDAEAQLAATLYDHSLDMLRGHSWQLGPQLYRSTATTDWLGESGYMLNVYSEMPLKLLNVSELPRWQFAPGLIPEPYNLFARYASKMKVAYCRAPQAEMMADGSTREVTRSNDIAAPAAGVETSDVPLRENFAETAFFAPNLRTDKHGNVSIRFTLPETLTTWRLLGVAHDKHMNCGTISESVIAQKPVMVQPNMPRFVRQGDKATIAVRLINTQDRKQSGTARLELINPETERVLRTVQHTVAIAHDTTAVVRFDFDTRDLPALVVCRISAKGSGFSDGEQHYLPVLPDKERVTNTQAFVLNAPGTKTVDVAAMFPAKSRDSKLTVEYTDNPAWLAIQALPTIAQTNDDNAVSLAAAYYANATAARIAAATPRMAEVVAAWQADTTNTLLSALQKNEELKNIALAETPWTLDADRERDQRQQLATLLDGQHTALAADRYLRKLRNLQHADGSFPWWKGMDGSVYMTTAVCQMLTRLHHSEATNADAINAKALGYLDAAAKREMELTKKAEKETQHKFRPSETTMTWLYLNALVGREVKGNADVIKFFTDRIGDTKTELTIYGKARTAYILNRYGDKKAAQTMLESVRQYTVYREADGRYFDTRKALYSWQDYRIPTQVAAIEALKALAPGDTATVDEMRRWLLTEKRTTAWQTPLNTVDAVFAFTDGHAEMFQPQPAAVLKVDGHTLTAAPTAALGYVKQAQTGEAFRHVTVEKKSAGTSWGAVYAQCFQPATQVTGAASGMTVKREVLDANGQPATQLHVGDQVSVRITITADHDYDFVQVSDKRAACMEPAQQLSGYRRGYYYAPKDSETRFYFDHLAKGTHTVQSTYNIDRAGTYTQGSCTVQCAYSPEYGARTAAQTLNVAQ